MRSEVSRRWAILPWFRSITTIADFSAPAHTLRLFGRCSMSSISLAMLLTQPESMANHPPEELRTRSIDGEIGARV